MPQMHLKETRFAYSACGPFRKKRKEFKHLKKIEDSRYTYNNELDKACFHHDMA